MHTEREESLRGSVPACYAALLKRALNITTYLARELPHLVTSDPLLSVYICMSSLCGSFAAVCILYRIGKLFLNSVPQVDRHHQYTICNVVQQC